MMAATARDTARMVVDEELAELTHAYVFPVSLSCVIYLARILQCVKTCKFALPAALDRSIHPVTLASGSSVAQLRRLTCARLVLE
jgi:hypothetical protein